MTKHEKRFIGRFLFAGALILFAFTLGRAMYSSALLDDSGLETATTTQRMKYVSATDLPSRLIIPKLNINALVQHLGVTASGNMAAPTNFTDVSWYKYGTVPGFKGSAVIAGHEDNAISLDGVFKHLEDLEVGDSVYVENADGEKLQFKVIDTEIYPYDKAPLEKIFHTMDDSYLVLITCAGDWLPSAKTNDKRLVVYTRLVES